MLGSIQHQVLPHSCVGHTQGAFPTALAPLRRSALRVVRTCPATTATPATSTSAECQRLEPWLVEIGGKLEGAGLFGRQLRATKASKTDKMCPVL